jgi:hypothetical protein
MKRFALCFTALFALTAIVYGQSMWSVNEKVLSASGDYYGNLKSMGNNTYEFTVYDSLNVPQWSSWVEWDDGFICLLSNDGKVFALIDKIYADRHSLVSIHRSGKQEAYSTKAIVVKPEYLGSVAVWFAANPGDARFIYDEAGRAISLELKAVTGEVFSIGL